MRRDRKRPFAISPLDVPVDASWRQEGRGRIRFRRRLRQGNETFSPQDLAIQVVGEVRFRTPTHTPPHTRETIFQPWLRRVGRRGALPGKWIALCRSETGHLEEVPLERSLAFHLNERDEPAKRTGPDRPAH